ncbi:MAG: TonB-dependent receptor plug domain-containing protein [Maribacter sp.]
MKKLSFFVFFLTALMISSCNSSKSTTVKKSELNKELNEKNKGNVSLLDRIRRKPGIVIRNGVPVINKASNSFSASNTEPLYVLNSYVVGSSFRSVNQLVDSFNVKDVKVLAGAEASEYGSRASNGVIIITTFD